MKLVSWNVNSVNARRERLLAWLRIHTPDVVCLQELKTTTDTFPAAELEDLGYHAAVFGQRSYNGVAILSRTPITDVQRGLPGDDADEEARFILGSIAGVRVASCYIPNGKEPTSDKYAYKKRWLARLVAHAGVLLESDAPLALCGDYNVCPEDRDCFAPESPDNVIYCEPEIRAPFARLLALGLVDTYRLHVPDAGKYSFWDYRMLSFPKGKGLRIDHILATPALAARCIGASIDREERKGKQPSDHAPVISEFT